MSSFPEPTGDRRHSLPEKRESGALPSPANPQKSVSVDEMMQQLRSPDGKKRRRRSHQPIYEKRRRQKFLAIILISLATLSIGGCWGFRFFQKIRLEGETFRDALNQRISSELGAVVKFTRLHDGGDASLAATSARIDLVEKDLFEYAELDSLNASLTAASWVSQDWGITRLNISEAKVRLNPARAFIKTDTTWIRSTGDEARTRASGWGISPTPGTISLDKISVSRSLTLDWPAPGTEKKTEGFAGLQCLITRPPAGGFEGHASRGSLTLKGLPEMPVNEIHWKLHGRKLTLDGSQFILGSGTINAAGEADLSLTGGIKLKVELKRLPLRELFSAVWRERLSGQVFSDATTFTATFNEGPERILEGDFHMEGLVLRNMTFVSRLANHLQRPDYMTGMEFTTVTGHFNWSPATGLTLSDLRAERPQEFRITGSLTASPAGQVNTDLIFSAHSNLMRSRPQDLPHPFGISKDDWHPVPLKLTGTGATLTDNLPDSGSGNSSPPPAASGPPPTPADSNPEESKRQFDEFLQPR